MSRIHMFVPPHLFVKEDIYLIDSYVYVRQIGKIGLWLKFDEEVAVDYSVGESFKAKTEKDVIQGMLKILNDRLVHRLYNEIKK